jgi:transposase
VQEAARDLVRAREDVRVDLMRPGTGCRSCCCARTSCGTGGRPWSSRHDGVAAVSAFDLPGRQLAFDAAYETMVLTLDRRNRLDAAVAVMAQDSEFTDLVHRLGCLRGVSALTGFGLAVEIGDWTQPVFGTGPNHQSCPKRRGSTSPAGRHSYKPAKPRLSHQP